MFVVIFYPSIVNLWVLKSLADKTFIFTISLIVLLFFILTGLGVYYDKIPILFWNIALILIMSVIFIVCWVIRKFFIPDFIKKLDLSMIDQKDKARFVIDENLKIHYKKIKKVIVIISAIYFIITFIMYILHVFKVEVFTGCPLPYIWAGIILLSALFAYNFNIKAIERLLEDDYCENL